MKTTSTSFASMILGLVVLVGTAGADERRSCGGHRTHVQHGTTYQSYVLPRTTYVQPYIVPSDLPKLGFSGQIIAGQGMRIAWVAPGGLVARAGLESGDVIVRMNGRLILCQTDYELALRSAVANGGHLDLVVRNIRSGFDWSAPQYVAVHIDLYNAWPLYSGSALAGGVRNY
jgi:hypothetical protein